MISLKCRFAINVKIENWRKLVKGTQPNKFEILTMRRVMKKTNGEGGPFWQAYQEMKNANEN